MNLKEWKKLTHNEKLDWMASHQPEEVKEMKRKVSNSIRARSRNAMLREICGTSARAAKADMGL